MTTLPRRSDIKLKFQQKDKLFELFCLLILLAYWLLVILNYQVLPDTVAIHYNSSGEIDGYGAKNKIWNLPISATILYLVMTAFSFVPQYFNYLEEITEENAERLYRKGVNTFRFLKLLVIVCFLSITLFSMFANNLHQYPIHNLVIAALPYIMLVPTFYYLFKN